MNVAPNGLFLKLYENQESTNFFKSILSLFYRPPYSMEGEDVHGSVS